MYTFVCPSGHSFFICSGKNICIFDYFEQVFVLGLIFEVKLSYYISIIRSATVEDKAKKENLKLIKSYMKMYEQNTMTKDQLKMFCAVIVDYCHNTRHANCSLPTPILEFEQIDPDTCGQYQKTNKITVNESYLDLILAKKDKSIVDLINTIGHEMEHYEQNSRLNDYDKMTAKQQATVDEKSKKIIDSYKNYFKLNEADVETLCRVLAPYRLKDYKSDKDFTPPAAFCALASFSSYYSISSEIDARKEGVAFSLDLMNELEKSGAEKTIFSKVFNYLKKDKSGDLSSLLNEEKIKQNNIKNKEEEYTQHSTNNMNMMAKSFTANEKVILDIARRVESYNGDLGHLNNAHYTNALKYLIKTKTLEEKKDLLKNAIFNGYNRIIGVLTDSISSDMDFKKNIEDISNFTLDCLNNRPHDETSIESLNAYYCDYSKIMTPKQFEQLVGETLNKSVMNAKGLILFNDCNNLSTDAILSYQNIAKKAGMAGKDFNEYILLHSSIQKKIELLQSNQVDKSNLEIITRLIKQDPSFKENAEEIESLLQTNQKRIAKDEQSKIPNSNTQDRKIMALYSKYMLNFYDDKLQNNGENTNYSEFKKINDKMLKYLKLKDVKIGDDLEISYSDMSMIEINLFNRDELNELRANKGAMRKLAYILGSGVYYMNGEKVNLTQSQQVGLAKLLAKLNERDLKNIKATNLSSIAKQLKSTTEKEIDGAENSL